jgi:hypothetical protein
MRYIFWDITSRNSMSPDVSEEHVTYIFEEYAKEAMLAICFILVYLMPYSQTMKMEATCSAETSVDFPRIKRCDIPEGRTLHNHHINTTATRLHISARFYALGEQCFSIGGARPACATLSSARLEAKSPK